MDNNIYIYNVRKSIEMKRQSYFITYSGHGKCVKLANGIKSGLVYHGNFQ